MNLLAGSKNQSGKWCRIRSEVTKVPLNICKGYNLLEGSFIHLFIQETFMECLQQLCGLWISQEGESVFPLSQKTEKEPAWISW